jgi:hypothetical protein
VVEEHNEVGMLADLYPHPDAHHPITTPYPHLISSTPFHDSLYRFLWYPFLRLKYPEFQLRLVQNSENVPKISGSLIERIHCTPEHKMWRQKNKMKDLHISDSSDITSSITDIAVDRDPSETVERTDKDIIRINSDLRAISPDEKLLPRVEVAHKKPTTITIVLTMNQEIDSHNVMDIMRINHLSPSALRWMSMNNGIPLTRQSGQIIQAKFGERVRGYRTTKTLFKNSVSMYMSTGTNNVSIKLSSNTIHMCGARSSDMAIEVTNHLIANILSGQSMLNRIQQHPSESAITKNLILELSCIQKYNFGRPNTVSIDRKVLNVLIDTIESWRSDTTQPDKDDSNFATLLINSDNLKISSVVNSKFTLEQLDQVDPNLLEFLIEHAYDMNTDYVGYIKTLDHLFSIDHEIAPPGLRLAMIKPAMVNITYNVGFKVKLAELCRIIENTNLPCRARFNPQYDKRVTLFFPCEVKGRSQMMKRILNETGEIEVEDRESKCCTLTVTSTGSVTQSNPTERLARDVHILFISIMTLIRNRITLR